jgi:hypothetical protein
MRRRLGGADHQDARAAAALSLPPQGVAGFARDPAGFRVRPSEMTGRYARPVTETS